MRRIIREIDELEEDVSRIKHIKDVVRRLRVRVNASLDHRDRQTISQNLTHRPPPSSARADDVSPRHRPPPPSAQAEDVSPYLPRI